MTDSDASTEPHAWQSPVPLDIPGDSGWGGHAADGYPPDPLPSPVHDPNWWVTQANARAARMATAIADTDADASITTAVSMRDAAAILAGQPVSATLLARLRQALAPMSVPLDGK